MSSSSSGTRTIKLGCEPFSGLRLSAAAKGVLSWAERRDSADAFRCAWSILRETGGLEELSGERSWTHEKAMGRGAETQ